MGDRRWCGEEDEVVWLDCDIHIFLGFDRGYVE